MSQSDWYDSDKDSTTMEEKVERYQKKAINNLEKETSSITHSGQPDTLSKHEKVANNNMNTEKVSEQVKECIAGVATFRMAEADGPVGIPGQMLFNLGNGKFVAIDFNTVSLELFKSLGAGFDLNMRPDRADAFFIPPYKWTAAIEKCALAARYSGEFSECLSR